MLAEIVGTVNVIQAKFTLIPPSPPNSGSIVELEALDRHQPSKINGNVCQELSNTALRGIRWNQGDNNDGKSKTHQFERIPGTVPRTSVLHCGMAKLQFISCANFNILKKYIIYLPTDSQTNNVTFVSNLYLPVLLWSRQVSAFSSLDEEFQLFCKQACLDQLQHQVLVREKITSQHFMSS